MALDKSISWYSIVNIKTRSSRRLAYKSRYLICYSYTDLIVQQFKMLQADSTEKMEKLTSYIYWKEISKIDNVHGEPKFAEVAKMSTTFMCLSHGNATPERGFSENKAVLDHRECLNEETIIALRITKDFLRNCDDVTQFPISRHLLTHCRTAREKYQAFLDLQRRAAENLKKQKLNDEKKKRLNEEKVKLVDKLKEIDNAIEEENVRLKVAESLVKDSNKTLAELISSNKTLNKKSLVQAQFTLETGIKRIDEIKLKLNQLNNEKIDCLKKKQK